MLPSSDSSMQTNNANVERIVLAPDIVQTTKGYLDQHLRPLRESGKKGLGGIAHARTIASVYDGLLSAYFLGAAAQVTHAVGLPQKLALVAVGGYGRSTLALGSDLDLILLVPSTDDQRAHALAETLLYPLWDAGVSIGHSVRTPEELANLAKEDLRTATSILDARYIAGDRAYATEALARGWRAVFDGDVNRFLDALLNEMTQRHARYGASVYLLEPDIKHGRGALRDIDLAAWALKARYRVDDFQHALRLAALSQIDTHQVESAQDFYWKIRAVLHGKTTRRSDRLTFDEQEECARSFGLIDSEVEKADSVTAVSMATEQLMQQYYTHARNVATTLDRLLESCRIHRASHDRAPRIDRVSDGIERFDNTLTFSESDGLKKDPVLALKIIDLSLRLGLPLGARTRETISHHTRDQAWCSALRDCPESGAIFLRLVTHSAPSRLRVRGSPASAAGLAQESVVAEIHDLGLLLAMVPEFEPVTGRVHHDIYHVYTVDVHSVAAVDRLHQIARGELTDQFSQAAHLLVDIERRDLVCLSTLLHDVGKGRGADHSSVGAGLANVIAKRLGLNADDARVVAWLVQEHLTLYHIATRRDLGDPATLSHVRDLIQDQWRLRALYLLTVADLSTTSPTALTSWKAKMLDELLRRSEEAIGSNAITTASHREELRRTIVQAAGADGPLVETFLKGMPDRYLLSVSPSSVLRHAKLSSQLPQSRASILLSIPESAPNDLVEVVIVAPDKPGLLARLAAMLYTNRLDVQSAQLYSRTEHDGYVAVDVFVARRLDDDPGALNRLSNRLPRDLQIVLREEELDKLVPATEKQNIRRPEPMVRAEVCIENDISDQYTVIEVFGRDRPGLLYAIARTLYATGLTIALAKVNTEGRRAADVFYVTDTHGGKVSPERFEEIREKLLLAVV